MKLEVGRRSIAITLTVFLVANWSLIWWFASPVFFFDEWDAWVGFLNNVHKSGTVWHWLWVSHNEHRLVLSKLIYFAESFFTTDTRVLMTISSFVWYLTLLELNRALKLFSDSKSRWDFLLLIPISAFGFSEIQSENFYWGMQLCYFLVMWGSVCTITSVVEGRYLRGAIYGAIAYFSLASWLALIPTLGMYFLWRVVSEKGVESRRRAKLAIGVFSAVALVAAGFYLYDFSLSQNEDLHLSFLQAPLAFVTYEVLFLGLPFASIKFAAALAMGLVMICFFLWVAKRHREAISPTAFLLAVHAVVVTLMITHARAGDWTWGHTAAHRYSTFLIPAWIGVYSIALKLIGSRRALGSGLAFFVAVAVWVAAAKGINTERGEAYTRNEAGACLKRLLQSQVIDESSSDFKCAHALYFPGRANFMTLARQWLADGRTLF